MNEEQVANAFALPGLNAVPRLILVFLASRADANGMVIAKLSDIAKGTETHPDTVKREMRKFRDKGWVARHGEIVGYIVYLHIPGPDAPVERDLTPPSSGDARPPGEGVAPTRATLENYDNHPTLVDESQGLRSSENSKPTDQPPPSKKETPIPNRVREPEGGPQRLRPDWTASPAIRSFAKMRDLTDAQIDALEDGFVAHWTTGPGRGKARSNWEEDFRRQVIATAERTKTAEIGTLEQPGPRRQRAWMDDWRENPHRWNDRERGPPPGAPGCRVEPEVLTGYGVTPN